MGNVLSGKGRKGDDGRTGASSCTGMRVKNNGWPHHHRGPAPRNGMSVLSRECHASMFLWSKEDQVSEPNLGSALAGDWRLEPSHEMLREDVILEKS
ncbi:hypothetical protein ACJRO7_029067 [Eucalyptus globulus]|uniref:Uncharacterized protein n=1 Tax=Eucalyptus globulus TaxID=34317 RepID=A0ABD3K6L6_EUCGL